MKVYDSKGKFEGVVAGPLQFAEGTIIADVAVDGSGRVLVLDPKARAVRVFSMKDDSSRGGETR